MNGTRKTGAFCWINMLTPKPVEACAFFGKVLGWTYGEIPGQGYVIQAGGADIGGLFDLEGPNTPQGTPAMIGVMVKVDNADATCDKVASLGGKARPPFDIMDSLRMAVCTDPNGAEFDLWESKQRHGTDADSGTHGVPSWFEAMTTDVDRAAAFYASLFGWVPEGSDDSGHVTFNHGGDLVAGLTRMSRDPQSHQARWATHFTVKDVDETARQAIALGGTVAASPQEIAGIGRVCGLRSPQGVPFHVIAY